MNGGIVKDKRGPSSPRQLLSIDDCELLWLIGNPTRRPRKSASDHEYKLWERRLGKPVIRTLARLGKDLRRSRLKMIRQVAQKMAAANRSTKVS